MLINLNFVLILLFLAGACRLYYLHDAAQARLQAKIAAIGLLVLSIILSLCNLGYVGWPSPAGHSPVMDYIPIVLCLTAVAITSFSPLASHPPQTFSRIFLLFAMALVFFNYSNLAVKVLCCIAANAIVWWELSCASKANGQRIFLMYQSASSLFLLVGVVLLASDSLQSVGVVCTVLAVMIRQGIVPFHNWFAGFVEHAPIGIVLAFFIPHLALFFEWAAFIDIQSPLITYGLAICSALTAIYSSLLALAQSNGRRVLGYLMLSQSGFLCFAFASQTHIALQGAFLLWLNSAIALTGFSLILVAIENRRGLLNIRRANGNFAHTPKLAISFLLFGFALVGFPSSLGYIAEDLLIQGNIAHHPFLAVVLVLSAGLNGFNVLRMFMMLFAGQKRPSSEPDLLRRETLAASLMLIPVFLLGFVPSLITDLSSGPSSVTRIEPTQNSVVALHPSPEQ